MQRIIFINVVLFLIGTGFIYSQCADKNIDKISQDIGRKIVEKCTSAPNKLIISTSECSRNTEVKTGFYIWKIKANMSWVGKYTTLHYKIKLYIELTLDKSNRVKTISIYLVDYSDSLIHRCIDLSNTKPLELIPGSVAYYPVIEMDPSELQ